MELAVVIVVIVVASAMIPGIRKSVSFAEQIVSLLKRRPEAILCAP